VDVTEASLGDYVSIDSNRKEAKMEEVTGRRTEITDEIMRAGIDAFYSYDARFDDVEDAIRRIWEAMIKLQKSK
jgi:hypothetical protein